jgi:hypothetical protein
MEPLSPNDPPTVGEFRLRARLGAGGMGRVYLGFSPAGRAVAVKVVHAELARNAEFRHRFGREVAAARAVSGMYTAPVVAAGLEDNPPWLATAYVPGPSLADVVAQHGALPEQAVWRLAAGLAEALHAVHECSLVHRDLKPANVLLAADGPHVIDFGISRAFEGTAVTAVGMVVGTPGYMSPEQAEGKQAGPASDVFSLGCVLAFAATGAAPFGGGSAAGVLYRVVSRQPDLAGVPERLREVISACLAKDPSRRPELAVLGAMITQAGPAVRATPTSFWPAPVAEMIRTAAAAAYPASLAHTATAPAGPAPAGSGMAGAEPANAGPVAAAAPGIAVGVGQPGTAQPGMAQAGTAQGGQRPGGAVQDGYYAAATASMAARRPAVGPARPAPWPSPNGAIPGPQAPPRDALSRYTPAPHEPWRPTSVVTAIWLMYGGAFLTVLSMIIDLVVISQVRSAYLTEHPFASQVAINRVNTVAGAGDFGVIIGSLVSIGLWIALALAARKGRGWMRTVGTVLFGIDTLVFIATIGRPGIAATKTIHLMIWLVGLLAVVFLWQRRSTQFFAASRRR